MEQPGTGHDRVVPGQAQPRDQLDQESDGYPPRPAGPDQDGEPPGTVDDDDEIVPL